jgi:hypothetical protein
MRPALIFIWLFFSGSALQTHGPDKLISCHFSEIPFTEFCNEIFRQTSVKIYYHDTWVKNLKVNLQQDSITVFSAVQQVIEGSGLELSVWQNDLVLLPGKKLLTSLPSFEQTANLNPVIIHDADTVTEAEARYITGRKPGVTQTITIGQPGVSTGNARVKVSGRVMDGETGEPVNYVSVYITETKNGVVSDVTGFFMLALSPGKYNVQIQCMGYETEKYLLDVLSAGSFDVRMKEKVLQMKEVVVSGERQSDIRSKDPGLDKISVQTIRSLPMMMGDRDILKVSGTLPGIVSVGEGSAGLNVRGGGYDQNAFYINNIPVYNTSHMFGFFPSFNSEIVKDFSIYKGHIPVEYGGKLASVFSITTRQGNRQHFTAHGSLSPVMGNLVLEGPLKKDTASFILSARTSYSDWLLSMIKDTTINSSRANFNDFAGGINFDLKNTQASLFFYHSYDHFRLSTINTYDYSNSGASLIFRHTYKESLRGELALVGSRYIFSTVDNLQFSSAYKHSYEMNHYEVRATLKQRVNEKNSLEYGADFVLYNLDRGSVLPFSEKSLISEVKLGKEKGIENSLFISDSYDITTRLNLNLGFRYTLFAPIGPATIYTYRPGEPLEAQYITDTLNYGKNKPIRFFHEPDLRLALNLETDEDGSVKLAFNQMHQNLFMLNTNVSLAPNAQWKLADYHLVPSQNNQISLGVFRSLPENGLEASLEVFYKRTSNYPEFKEGADFLGNPLVETSVLQGKQKSYGIEFNLKRSRRRLEGWLSYTYSRSLIRVDGEHTWSKINNGLTFPANYDIPHSLNAVLNYSLSRRVILSSIMTYQTGRPTTYPESVFYIQGVPYLDYSKRNSYRIPYYLRTDLSLTLEGNLKKNKIIHSSLVLNIYNILGRRNPNSVYFVSENGRIKSYMYSVIGVPVFTATWLFKFGNYASD